MRALAADVAERLRVETVDLDPEQVHILDRAQDLQIALGLGVEVEIEQQIDIGPGAVADRLEMHAEIAQHGAVDIDFGLERRAEAGPPALRLAVGIDEDVGLHRGETFFAHLAADSLDAVEIGDRGLEPVRMINAPSRAMRPVHPYAVADLAAEQIVAGHAERLGL